jgi:flagellar biosynthesis protein FliR
VNSAPADISGLLAHVVPFTLVAFRLAGLFIMLPVVASPLVPMRGKAMLAFVLAAGSYPLVASRVGTPAGVDLPGLVAMIVGEAMVGLVMGLIASIPMVSMEMAGVLGGQTMGLGLARVYNPEVDADADVLGQLYTYVALGVFVAVGGVESLFAGVLSSFDRVPLGSALALPTADAVTGALAGGFELALRVALPVVGISLLLILTLGVISKAMPAFNVMSVGFTLKLIVGTLIVALSLAAAGEAVGDAVRDAVASAVQWVSPER